jgi:hypothetical protein
MTLLEYSSSKGKLGTLINFDEEGVSQLLQLLL